MAKSAEKLAYEAALIKSKSLYLQVETMIVSDPVLHRAYWHVVGLLPTPRNDDARTRQRIALAHLVMSAHASTFIDLDAVVVE